MAGHQQTSYYVRPDPPEKSQVPADWPQQKRSSYRRTSDHSQPVQPYQDPAMMQMGAPVQATDPQFTRGAQNGNGSFNLYQMRDPQMSDPRSRVSRTVSLPTAPNVPRGMPPVSYRHPYGPTSSESRPPANGRSYSSRVQAQPGYQSQPQYQDAYDLDPASQTNPAQGAVPRTKSSTTRRPSDPRRNSVPDRSPLQTLEGKLDDISKEEKRARVVEAELLAQQTAATRARRSSRNTNAPAVLQKRRVSDSNTYRSTGDPPIGGQRQTSDPNAGLLDARYPEKGTIDFGPPWNPQQPQPAQTQTPQYRDPPLGNTSLTASRSNARDGRYYNAGTYARPSENSAAGIQRGPSFRERSGLTESYQQPAQGSRSTRDELADRDFAAVGLGLYDADDSLPEPKPKSSGGPARGDSQRQPGATPQEPRQFSGKPPERMPTSQRQAQTERTGMWHGSKVARKYQEPDPVPAEEVRNIHADVPKYEIPPQTASGQRARDQVGFGALEPADVAPPPPGGHHRHLPSLTHSRHDPERRYQVPPALNEWRKARTAALRAEDFLLDAVKKNENRDSAWWERSASQRRQSGTTRQPPVSYDGPHIDATGQTSFDPPLYLRCGPLLRYTGLSRDKPLQADAKIKEIWNGTVLIVTDDSKSSETPPILRIFSQPMDMLPPPPAELGDQQLDPEYVDPISGQCKVSRIGKTLYVKPVEHLEEGIDLSRVENDGGLFEETRSSTGFNNDLMNGQQADKSPSSRIWNNDGEKAGKFREVQGIRLHAERGLTFWRFNISVELGTQQRRVAYRINRGPAIGFWVPASGETMNIMFHSCNGFSLSVNPNEFSGPDPLWRDVLNTHQTRPFHVMIGGGDQLYNDAVMRNTTLFQQWLATKSPDRKYSASFTTEMQHELEVYYLNRYCMWFSQGLFGMAASQIPMVNMWDDHDIIDGFGSYPNHFMSTAVFSGVGAVAFKYYMLFQQQSVPDESEKDQPSWLLGSSPGPYINELSRSIFMFLGRQVAFLALDCRTERMRDEIFSEETYDRIFDRCDKEIIKGETKHLIVLLGVPIAYPRLNFLENILTSRVMDPIKALARAGMLGNLINKFDGGVEILDDLDDHWTAKHHKHERNWLIQEFQEIAAEKSVRVTILSGDVHLGAVGQFYSNKKLGLPKDRDHRYMPNVISSAIVNTPPPNLLADVLNRRNKVHHLDENTDEDMIPMFSHDVDGTPRHNQHLLPRRNWCSIREYRPGTTPTPTPPAQTPPEESRPGTLTRTLSLTRRDFTPGKIVRRLSRGEGPPISFRTGSFRADGSRQMPQRRHSSSGDGVSLPSSNRNSYFEPPRTAQSADEDFRPNPFHRRPTGLSEKAARRGGGPTTEADERAGHIDLSAGLDIVLNVEVTQGDPAGITTPYRLLVPALDYRGPGDINTARPKGRVDNWLSGFRRRRKHKDELQHKASFESAHDVHLYDSQPDRFVDQEPYERTTGQRVNSAAYDDDFRSEQPLGPPPAMSPLATPAAVSTAMRRASSGAAAPSASPLPAPTTTRGSGDLDFTPPAPSGKALKLLGASAPGGRVGGGIVGGGGRGVSPKPGRMEARREYGDDDEDELDDYHRATRRISGMSFGEGGRSGGEGGMTGTPPAEREKRGSKRWSGWRIWK